MIYHKIINLNINKFSKMGTCSSCGEYADIRYKDGQCQACYNYFRNGGKIHPLPKYGTIEKDENGNPICHICGRSFSKLGSHIFNFHGIKRKDYSKQYGLDNIKGICSDETKKILRKHIERNYDKVVTGNLIENPISISNRFKKGCEGRTKEKVSQQTLNRLKRK